MEKKAYTEVGNIIDGTRGVESGNVNKLSELKGESVWTSGAVLGAISAKFG